MRERFPRIEAPPTDDICYATNRQMAIDAMSKKCDLILFMTNDKIDLQKNGALQDVAPTLLGILDLDQPSQMKGKDLRIKMA